MEPASGVTKRLVERLSRATDLAVLTGAGVSQESGIPTFRGEEGLWKEYRAEELATWRAFESDPGLVWSWYDYRRQLVSDADPNPAHRAIAELEKCYPQFSLITQNTDGLHDRAGSSAPVELHGNIWRARCTVEQTVCELLESPLPDVPPHCPTCGSLLRPDVVWYGEPLPMDAYERSHQIASRCDAMLVVGTSAVVHPAASLPLVAKHNGAFVVEVNTAYTPISALVDATLLGMASDLLPEIARRVLEAVGSRGSGVANPISETSRA
ncbi:MAG: NAD-dependent deacylase [Candidatus Eisenbacteria sp.]|nr:NAD-dependent deacylase [Candidatus Eisenbacteria bacterium]